VTAPGYISAESLRTTRASLHAVAEHVMAASQYARMRRLGLRQATGGFATQPFVVDGAERRIPIASLRAAAHLTGGPIGMPSGAYRPSPLPDPDAQLAIDPTAAALLAGFYALVQAALTVFTAELAREGPSEIQLWSEHFDLATTLSEVNYGGSPGDADRDEPYPYVRPFEPPPRGGFWNEPFGASPPWGEIAGVDDGLRFFREGRAARRQG
jgi:hypothetical protein